MSRLHSLSVGAVACLALMHAPCANAQAYVAAGLGQSLNNSHCELGVDIQGRILADACRRVARQGALRGGFVWATGWGIEAFLSNAGATQTKIGSTVTSTVGVPNVVVSLIAAWGPGAHYQIDATNMSVAFAGTRVFLLTPDWRVTPKLGWAASRGRLTLCVKAPSYDGNYGEPPCGATRTYAVTGAYAGVDASYKISETLRLNLGLDSLPVGADALIPELSVGGDDIRHTRAVAYSVGLTLSF